jgi:uncharacterized protein (TIGR04255 family)
VTPIVFNLAETFPHLSRAPILEAVIEIRTRALATWDETTTASWLKSKLPDYPTAHAGHGVQLAITVQGQGKAEQDLQDLGLKIFRFQSADNLHVAQFSQDGFAFSRLQPYSSWDLFHGEAMRLWALHCQLSQAVDIQRLGVRFINRISLPAEEIELGKLLHVPPRAPRDLHLPIAAFLHQDAFGVPGHPYFINVVRTIQPPMKAGDDIGLVLDIDVQSPGPFRVEDAVIDRRLTEMRWLKNKAFFGSITVDAAERFR